MKQTPIPKSQVRGARHRMSPRAGLDPHDRPTRKAPVTYTIERSISTGEVRYTGYYYLAEKKLDRHGKLKPVARSAGTAATEAEALTLANAKQREVDLGFNPDPEIRASITVADFIPRFLDKHPIAASTRDSYRRQLNGRITTVLGTSKVSDLSRPILQLFLDRLRDEGVPATVLRTCRAALRSLLAYAQRIGIRDDNPADNLAVPTLVRKGEKAWASEVFISFREHLPTEGAKLFAELQVKTGARISELCALAGGDIDRENGGLHITKAVMRVSKKHNGTRLVLADKTKTGRERFVELGTDILNRLVTYIDSRGIGQTDILFPARLVARRSTSDDYLGPDTWAYIFKQAFKASGLAERLWIPAKNLRHTHIIDCIEVLRMDATMVALRVGNSRTILMSNYIVQRLSTKPRKTTSFDALDTAYAA